VRNRQIRVADPVTSASTSSPIASTLRLWPPSPVITDTVPDSRPKTTEIQTSHSAAVTCPSAAGRERAAGDRTWNLALSGDG
jgi:hypothetical protein